MERRGGGGVGRIRNEVTLRRLNISLCVCVCVAWAPGVVLYIRFVTAKRSEEKTIESGKKTGKRERESFFCFSFLLKLFFLFSRFFLFFSATNLKYRYL